MASQLPGQGRRRLNRLKGDARRSVIRALTRTSRVTGLRGASEAGLRLLFNQVAPTWDAIRADGTYLVRFGQALDRLAELHPDSRTPASVLDVACGTGLATELLAERFPDARIAGQDIASAMVERARERVPRGEFATGSSAQLPFADGEFDLVTSVDGVWEAAELARVTAPGGCILLIFTFGGACPVARDLAPVAEELEALGMECDLELDESWTLVARNQQ